MFTEPDWRLAVQRFRHWEANRDGLHSQISIPITNISTALGDVPASAAFAEIDDAAAIESVLRHELGHGDHRNPIDTSLLLRLAQNFPMELIRAIPTTVLWRHFREELITRQKWCAEAAGIEQLAYLRDIKPVEPLPAIQAIKDLWEAKSACTRDQTRKVLRAWEGFEEGTGIQKFEDIEDGLVVAYRDDLHEEDESGKQQAHICAGVRRLITFAIGQAIRREDFQKILACLKLLTPGKSPDDGDPQPIEIQDWRKLLQAAEGEERAMILLMLNCALYLRELVHVEWSEIKDGCFLSNRKKTGKCIRAAALWPETIAAVEAMPRKGNRIFYSQINTPLSSVVAFRRFMALRDKAKVNWNVKPSHLRDGLQQAATKANVNTRLVDLAMGHKCGIASRYIKVDPAMVKPATDAVYKYYFG
jgi:integrase